VSSASSRIFALRSESFLFNRLPSSLPHPSHLPEFMFLFNHRALTADKQLVPLSEAPASSSVDSNAAEVQNSSTSVVYYAPPPLYPPIAGIRARERGIADNLMTDFVDVDNPNGFGVVMSLADLMTWIVS
jgi:hypothetical protein